MLEKKEIKSLSIYTLSDLGVLSNLTGSLSLANEHYSPPTEWIMRKPKQKQNGGCKLAFRHCFKSICNGFLLKMLLRSLSVYILKQLFFSISVNSGRIFTSISKNNCYLLYKHQWNTKWAFALKHDIFSRKDIYVIYRAEGPYGKKLCPRSWVRAEA